MKDAVPEEREAVRLVEETQRHLSERPLVLVVGEYNAGKSESGSCMEGGWLERRIEVVRICILT